MNTSGAASPGPAERELRRAAFVKFADAAKALARERTLPLFAVRRGPPVQIGSAVLVDVGGDGLLLTAAHVVDLVAETRGEAGLATPGARDGEEIIPTGTVRVHRSPLPASGKREHDMLDVAWIELSSEHAERLRRGGRYRFTRLHEIDVTGGAAGSGYLVYGYPAACASLDEEAKSSRSGDLSYFTHEPRGGLPKGVKDFDPELQLLLTYERAANRGSLGELVEAPRPEGVSGGGLWRLSRGPRDLLTWSLDDFRLAGVQYAWSGDDEYVRGTRMRAALAILHRHAPALRPAIDLHVGTTWPRL